MTPTLVRRLTAEAVGTALLVAVVVGSGIFAERLSDDVGLQLLENSLATAGGLLALILAFGSVSGAHFNPVVTLAERVFGGLTTGEALAYVPAQIVGGCVGRSWRPSCSSSTRSTCRPTPVRPGRSQMALGWFNHLAEGRAVAWSGGPDPGKEVNPRR